MISVCIITKNEERALARCLESVQNLGDELIVVDACSTDRTLEIAKKYTEKVYTNPWPGFAEQRNFAIQKAKGDWIFFMDADEKASPELGAELKQIASRFSGNPPYCYAVKRIEYFLGKELHYGPGNPSFQWRFFKKDRVHFVGEIHEYPQFEGGVGNLKAPIYHWPDLSIEKFLNKLNQYTTLEAFDRFAEGQRTSLLHALATFISTFLKNGIRYRAFWNGKPGLILTVLESFSRVVRHLKLWVLWQVYEGKLQIKLDRPLPKPGSKKPPSPSELNKEEIHSEGARP